jgi:hypothetical protein
VLGTGIELKDRRRSEAVVQRLASSVSAAAISHYAPGEAQQSGQRVIRHLLEPAPRSQEHLGHNVVGRCRRYPAMNERAHRRAVRTVHSLEPRPSFDSDRVGVRQPPGVSPHRPSHELDQRVRRPVAAEVAIDRARVRERLLSQREIAL